MITNGGVGNEDADMAECDGEKVVTMMDVLQEEQDFEDDANAVLGASDEKNCTYSKGYIKRQAIYACLTCCTEAKYDPTKRAGVCLACSLNCHENHELVELYTKRNFCCDCGNPKFNSHPCQFTPNKNDLNEDNNYNQNFSGLYCRCHRPYPDPDSTIDDDEMIQCIICEDWLHASHLDTAVPAIEQYSEMVCKACMEKNEFLHDYSHLAVNIEVHDVDIEVNGTDTTLSNVELNTEKLINGTDDTSTNTTEKPSDNMDVDKALIEDKSPTEKGGNKENSTPQTPVEETDSDVTMETENTKEPSDVNTMAENDSNPDINAEKRLNPSGETIKESTTVTEEKPEEIANITSEERPKVTTEEETTKFTSEEETTKVSSEEETTKVTSEGETTKETLQDPISESQESKETLLENAEESKHSQESEDTKKEENDIGDVVSGKPEESTELSENKNETVEKTSENDKDEASEIDSKKAKEDENTSITTDVELNTNNAEIDNEINDSNKETPNTKNTDLPQDNITNKADSMETDKISSDVVSESVINKEESNESPSNVNKDDNSEAIIEEPNETENKITEVKEMKRKLSTEDTAVAEDHLVKKTKFNEETCFRPKGVKRVYNGATFWHSNLRQKLCTCSVCVSMYKDLSVLFLIDPEDTVFAYETLGKERVNGRATQYEKGLEALSSLDRIQQINALTEYNKMRDKLLDFLKSFKDRKEVVKEEDIKAFFAGMKPKREPDGVYFCR